VLRRYLHTTIFLVRLFMWNLLTKFLSELGRMFAIVVKSVSQQKNLYIASKNKNVTNRRSLKPGFHYPS